MPADLDVVWDGLTSTQLALLEFKDGKHLKAILASSLYRALKPAEHEVRSGLLGMRHHGLTQTQGEPLRRAVHRGIKVEETFPSTAEAGARIIVGTTPNTRRFTHAPRAINARGWRHPVFGRRPYVTQVGKPGFFDRPLDSRKAEFHKVIEEVLVDFARLVRAESRKGGE